MKKLGRNPRTQAFCSNETNRCATLRKAVRRTQNPFSDPPGQRTITWNLSRSNIRQTQSEGHLTNCLACTLSVSRSRISRRSWRSVTNGRKRTNTEQDSECEYFCCKEHHGRKWQSLDGIWGLDGSELSQFISGFWWLMRENVIVDRKGHWFGGILDHHAAIYSTWLWGKVSSVYWSCSPLCKLEVFRVNQ